MAKSPQGDNHASELHPDAWERFESAVDVVAKSPPQHRAGKKPKERKSKIHSKIGTATKPAVEDD
jgi:hypothetical protein